MSDESEEMQAIVQSLTSEFVSPELEIFQMNEIPKR
jgi:hypothetical protein